MDGLQQPPAPNAPPKAPSPLELAIWQFENSCREYHAKRAEQAPAEESSQQAADRKAVLQKELRHLEMEREKILSMTHIQAQLEQYRADCRGKSVAELKKESHHPTDDLVRNMAAIGEPKPSANHDAHHIIPGRGQYQQDQIQRARTNMHLAGIGIQDPRNGIYLPRSKEHKGHWSMPNAPAHKEIHRYNYETWIYEKFQHPIPEKAFEGELLVVKALLRDGHHPNKIIEPKDPHWDGKA